MANFTSILTGKQVESLLANYATCTTSGGTAAKVATISSINGATPQFELFTGLTVRVKFSNSNTVANPTLNVNGTGAKPIIRYGTTIPGTTAATSWSAGAIVALTYDGTSWVMNDSRPDQYNGDITGVTAGNGLTGGATSGAATLNVGAGNGISVTADAVSAKAGSGITVDANGINANTSFTTSGKKYKVEVDTDTGGLFVNVPWVDTDTNTWRGIQNNLTSDSTTDSLSAAQGKVLKGLIDSLDTELDGKANASHGTHVTSSTVKSALGVGIGKEKFLREDGTWVTPTNTTYDVATSTSNGLMSATDKSNLDTIVSSFNDEDSDTTINTVKEVLKAFENAPEGTNIANALAAKSDIGHTHTITTADAAPNGHTHSVSVSGTTSANSGTAVSAVTGYASFSGGSGKLEAYDAATSGTKKVSNGTRVPVVTSVTHTPASLSGTTTFVTKQGTFNAGTTPVSTATFAGTEVTSTENSGDAVVALTGVKVSSSSSAAPGGHTHSYTKTTGASLSANTETATGRITYVESISGGSGSLTTDTTSTNGIKYVESISSTKASASGTAKAGSETHTHTYTKATGVDLGSNDTAEDGIAYVDSVTHAAATLSGTTSFNTDAIKSVSLSASSTSSDGPVYVQSVSGGSGSLKSYDASTDGTAKTSSGRIPYVHSISGGSASGTGAGTAAPNEHTHSYTKYSLSGSNSSHTKKYMKLSTTTADTGTVGISGGSGSLEAYDAATDGTKKVSNGTRIPVVTSISSTAASANGTAVVLTGVKSGSTDTFLKEINSGSGSLASYDAATNGNVKTANGTRIPFVADVSHTAASLSGTTTFIKTATLDAGTTPVDSATPSHTSTATGSAGAGTASQATGAATPTFTGTAVTSGGASIITTSSAGGGTANQTTGGTTVLTSASVANEVLTITSSSHTHTYTKPAAHTHTLSHTHSVTAAGNVSSHTHTYTKPEAHTHTYDKTTSITLNRGTAPSLTTSTGTVSISGGSISKTVYYLAHSHTGASAKSSASAVTSVASDGTATVLTGVKGGTVTATTYYLSHGHTAASLTGTKTFAINGIKAASLSASTTSTDGPVYVDSATNSSLSLSTSSGTTGTNSGTGVSTISGVSYTAPTATTYYLEHAHTAASATSKYMKVTPTAATKGTVSISGGSITPVVKYFHPTITTESVASGTPSATTSFVTGVSGGTTSATTKYLHHGHTAASATTKYLGVSLSTASETSGTNSGTNFNAATAVAANGTANVAPNGHTHAVTAEGTITLTRGTAPSLGSASTGTVGISGGSITPTTYYLEHGHSAASLGTPSKANVAPSGHTHTFEDTATSEANNGTAVKAAVSVAASTN